MDIAGIDVATKNALAAQYRGQGILVLSNVDLPAGFEPRVTDVVFLEVYGQCEVYFDARITYGGGSECWHDLMAGTESPGHTRFIANAADFFGAIRTLVRLLSAAQPTIDPMPANDHRGVWLRKLGLSGDPSVEQIKKAYRRLALLHHPDRMAGATPAELSVAGERMREIVEAHRELLNSERTEPAVR